MNEDDKEHVLDAIQWYQPLMHEVRIRLDIVDSIFEGRLSLPGPYAHEYSYLHFRKICELIALGCLRLHGDLPETQTKYAQKEWQAVNIVKLLSKSFSDSFPKPISVSEEGNKIFFRREIRTNALTYEEFATLYSECGDALHRGSIKMLRDGKPLTLEGLQRIKLWQSKLIDLLSEHEVKRHSDSGNFVIRLIGENGYPECSHYSPSGKGGLHVTKRLMNVSDDPSSEAIPSSGATSYIISVDGPSSAV